MDYIIEKATVHDIPVLAELNRKAYMPETAAMIAFPAWPDERNMSRFFNERVTETFSNPDTTVYKAVISETSEIIGFVCWTLEKSEGDGEAAELPAKPSPTSTTVQKAPEGLNMKFIQASMVQIEKLRKLMLGSRHYYVSTFVVPPKHQRHGIGSSLLCYCLSQADQERVPTWLISFPGSHSLYLRFSFEDVSHVDIDLNYWDGCLFRGFGIYRNYAMVRNPR